MRRRNGVRVRVMVSGEGLEMVEVAMGLDQYILLPREGVRTVGGPAFDVLVALPSVRGTEAPASVTLDIAGGAEVRILDTVSENGPKLVELDPQAVERLNHPESPVRVVPVIEYPRPDLGPQPYAEATTGTEQTGSFIEVLCTDAATGQPVEAVRVVAFTDYAQRTGAVGYTNASGRVTLLLATSRIERLYGFPVGGYWSGYQALPLGGPQFVLPLVPVDLALVDSARHYFGASHFDPTTGVKVGVVDTGVGPHSLINCVGGLNAVTNESDTSYADGAQHGTHVAGLIGANGKAPNGVRGIAPGVPIMSYRVFPVGKSATNYSIVKALIFAAQDGCDIVNLSLGSQSQYDAIVDESILDARAHGMLLVIAAGNDNRTRVSYPAAYDGATAISAMGREGTFPLGTDCDAAVVRPPFGTVDPLEFIAGFSSVGPEVSLTAPGVGLVSTLPGERFGPMSGTSQATPVVAGAAACLLSRDKVIYSMPRNMARAEAIQGLLLKNAVKRGFGSNFEGFGLPDPALV